MATPESEEESYEDFARRVIAQSQSRTGAKHVDPSQITFPSKEAEERYKRLSAEGLHTGYTQFREEPRKRKPRKPKPGQ